MSVVHAFDLRFLTPLRIGAGARDDADTARDFPSDTLSAALVIAAADLSGERFDGRPLEDVAQNPPWVVSSFLPWVVLGGRRERFVPRPVDLPLGGAGQAKAYRKVAYVEQALLRAPRDTPPLSRCGMLAATVDSIRQVTWQARAARPSITVDRVTSATHLFHLEEAAMGMSPGTGAWVAVRTENAATMKLVRALLEHLAESGIGADRARGLGRFVIEGQEPWSLEEASRPGRLRMLLGYASPDAGLVEALGDARARYTVIRREGKAHGARGGLGMARKSLRLLGPGSVLPDRGAMVGRTRVVTPEGFREHAICRDGRTLAWPLPEVRR